MLKACKFVAWLAVDVAILAAIGWAMFAAIGWGLENAPNVTAAVCILGPFAAIMAAIAVFSR